MADGDDEQPYCPSQIRSLNGVRTASDPVLTIAVAKREAALEFIEYVAKSGAASPVMIEQWKLAARLWAYEQGAPDDPSALQAENARILAELSNG